MLQISRGRHEQPEQGEVSARYDTRVPRRFSRVLATVLLTLCVGLQTLEASGRWDGSFQDSGDEAVIVAAVLCIGSALIAARVAAARISAPVMMCVLGRATLSAPAPPTEPSTVSVFGGSPPLGLRI